MPMNAKIDTVLLTNQPSAYREEPVEPVIDYAADGTPLLSIRSGDTGRIVVWEFGDVAEAATVTELMSKRRNGGATVDYVHAIEYTDLAGATVTYAAVLWPVDPTIEVGRGAVYRGVQARFVVL